MTRRHRCLTLPIATAAIALAGSSAQALILNGGMSAQPGISYVGLFNGGTAVPIGPHTLLTAAHVGGGKGDQFWLNGRGYRVTQAITSPTADLLRIEVAGTLPGWYPLATEAPKKGAQLTIAGWGITADSRVGSGFTWSDDRAQNWGINTLDSTRDGYLWFKFDKKGGSQEAILTPGDSGGAVFIKGRDGQLQLAGINRAVYMHRDGQASFGDTSIAVNLLANGTFLAGLGTVVPAPASACMAMGVWWMAARRRR